MEPPRTKVEIGQFRVIEVSISSIRIALGQGVNAWIHMNFNHSVKPGDILPLFTEIPYASTLTAPIE